MSITGLIWQRVLRFWGITVILSALVAGMIVLLCTQGDGALPASGWWQARPHSDLALRWSIFWYLKLPGVLAITLVGVGLGLAGAIMQGLLQNPLADPTILGVSSGSGFFALLVLLTSSFITADPGMIMALMLAGALLGALLVLSILLGFAALMRQNRLSGVLLAGVALSAMFGALTVMMMNFMPALDLKTSVAWAYGSFSGTDWAGVAMVAGTLLAGSTVLLGSSRALDVLMLGPEEAQALGVSLFRLLSRCVLGIGIIIAGSVAVAGPVGFVGLIAPHMARALAGARHQQLLPHSALVAALMMLGAEWGSKYLVPPYIIPLSAITALMGGPFFLWLLWRLYRY